MIQLVPHNVIRPSPLNPRKSIAEEALTELAESIKAEGLLQNLVVRPRPEGGYEIAAGERRHRAIGHLIQAGDLPGDHQVPVVIRDLTDLQLLQLATTENLARADMTPMEEARAFARMLELGSDVPTIAAETGLSERTVKTRLALVERLAPAAVTLLEDGKITLGQAQALLSGSEAAQERLATKAGWQGELQIRNLTPADIRSHLKREAIPVSRAKFDVAKYTGEITPASIFDPEAEETFADVELFHSLQAEHAKELAKEARRNWAWAEITDWFRHYDYDRIEGEATDEQRAKAGVVIELDDRDGILTVHEGVIKRTRVVDGPGGSISKPERDPLALTGKHQERINTELERAVQASLADNRVPTFAILAFSLLQTHYPDFLTVGYRGANTARNALMETLHPRAKKHLENLQLGPITRRALETHPRNDPNDFSLLKELMSTSMADLTGLLTLLIPLAINASQRWDAGKLDRNFIDLWSLLEGPGHDQPSERLPTWRELGSEWLLMYTKPRLEQIYQEATGEEPGASLTRKNLAAGILDHARPGWLDQVPPELQLPEEPVRVHWTNGEPPEVDDDGNYIDEEEDVMEPWERRPDYENDELPDEEEGELA